MSRRPAACGSESGYKRHLHNREPACKACCAGHAAHNANWRARHSAFSPVDPLRYRAVLLGLEPAEALGREDRHRVVKQLHRRGWNDARIAVHTRMTTYTTTRIRRLLGLSARPVSGPRLGWVAGLREGGAA